MCTTVPVSTTQTLYRTHPEQTGDSPQTDPSDP